ncbi:hypothetical protein GCM10008090_27610 [Arenicella chitinivorans]|uniref:Uncharacterized protein n=1 Tax=Arenicella chitinivorans TaxID=1329800 RepID=A0A918RYR2_9GAMM|nr:hypothetical protein [Arenicella chitinivorans]GHA16284.1 hypothetical protein GCM10008090_27610 [Arenicella chitinivorans]
MSDFIWHDGNINSLNYSVAESGASLAIEAEFYSTPESTQRDKFTINCRDVTRFNNVINFLEVKDNYSAGSVSNGYLRGNTLWLYLLDGVIEIHADQISVSRR